MKISRTLKLFLVIAILIVAFSCKNEKEEDEIENEIAKQENDGQQQHELRGCSELADGRKLPALQQE